MIKHLFKVNIHNLLDIHTGKWRGTYEIMENKILHYRKVGR